MGPTDQSLGNMTLSELLRIVGREVSRQVPPIPKKIAELADHEAPLIPPTTANDGQALVYEAASGGYVVSDEVISAVTAATATLADAATIAHDVDDNIIATAKLVDGAVTTIKINDLAVTNAKIGNLAVDTANIAALAVSSAKIALLAVGTAQINDLAVTDAKINDLSAAKITAGFIDTARLSAGSIDADKLRATLTFSNVFQTSATGTQRIVMDGTAITGGIFLYPASGTQPIISLPLDPLASASFTGNITTGAITITGNLTIQGTTNIMDKGSALTLNEKLGDASVAPTLSWEYNNLTLTGGTNGYLPTSGGIFYDAAGGAGGATAVYYVGCNAGGSARVEEYDAATGVMTGRSVLIGPGDDTIYGLARIGTKIWVLSNNGSLIKTWTRITQSTFVVDTTFAATNLPNTGFTVTGYGFGATGTGALGVGTDGTYILTLGWASTSNGAAKTIKRHDMSTGTPVFHDTQTLINGATFSNPLGTARQCVGICSDGTNYWTLIQRFNSSGTPLGIEVEKYVISTLTLGTATGDSMFDVDLTSAQGVGIGYPQGITWDSTNSRWALGTSTTRISRMASSWIPSSSKLWVAYAWQVAGVTVGTCTVSTATPSLVTCAAHGLSANDEIYFTNTGGALPTGITANTPYYVRSASLTTGAFTFSTTKGGSGVHCTTTGSGTQNLFKQQESLVSPRSSVALTDSNGNQQYRKRVRVTTVAFSSTITNAPIYVICQTATPATTDLLKERVSSGFLDIDSDTPMLITGEDTGGQTPRTTSNLAGATSTIQGTFANGTPWAIGGDGTFVLPLGHTASPVRGQIGVLTTTDRVDFYDGATNGWREFATLADVSKQGGGIQIVQGLSRQQGTKSGTLVAESIPWEIALLSCNAKATPAGMGLTDGRLTLMAVWLEAGTIISTLRSYTTATTGAISTWKLSLWSYNGTTFTCIDTAIINSTATGWRGGGALETNTTYTIPTTGIYYLGFMFHGTATGTVLGFVDGGSLVVTTGDFTGGTVNGGFASTTYPRVVIGKTGITTATAAGDTITSSSTGYTTNVQNVPYVSAIGTIL